MANFLEKFAKRNKGVVTGAEYYNYSAVKNNTTKHNTQKMTKEQIKEALDICSVALNHASRHNTLKMTEEQIKEALDIYSVALNHAFRHNTQKMTGEQIKKPKKITR